MLRKMISVLLTVLLFASAMALPAFAEELDTPEDETLEEEYQYVNAVVTSLSIRGTTAYIAVFVDDSGNNTTQIHTTAYLQKKSGGTWKNVANWSKTVTTNYLNLSKSKTIASGKYRVKSVTKAYSGNNYETITSYSGVATKN